MTERDDKGERETKRIEPGYPLVGRKFPHAGRIVQRHADRNQATSKPGLNIAKLTSPERQREIVVSHAVTSRLRSGLVNRAILNDSVANSTQKCRFQHEGTPWDALQPKARQ